MAYVSMIVNKGFEITSNRLKGAGTEPKYIGWGTGTAETTASMATLGAESADESRTSGSSSITTVINTNDSYQVEGQMACLTNPKVITEMALFDDSTEGNMFLRSNFGAVTVNPGEMITFTVTIQQSR